MSHIQKPNQPNYEGEACLNSENVIITLHKTFEFIQSHCSHSNHLESDCVLTLKISLLQFESNLTDSPVSKKTNTIYGNIKKVHQTFVELSYSTVENETFVYTIAYEDIISIRSSILDAHYEQYLHCLSKLPPICKDKHNPAAALIHELNQILHDEAFKNNYVLVLLVAGILSETFEFSNVDIVKNLMILNQNLVVPITQVSGFVIKPLQ